MSIIDKVLEANKTYPRRYRLAPAPIIRTGGPAVTEDVLGECPRNDGGHAPQSHWLRIHDIH